MKKLTIINLMLLFVLTICAQTVNIIVPKDAHKRVNYAAEYLQKHLQKQGLNAIVSNDAKGIKADHRVILQTATDTTGLKKEGFSYVKDEKKGKVTVTLTGNDPSGCIYGCNELAEQVRKNGFVGLENHYKDAPQMVLRGACIGMQKPYLLPGRMVYEYPYTPELFPWFYDKQHWTEYLDMLVENRMNSVYLWSGHPFASLVKLPDYPFAVEVDEATFQKNHETMLYITEECDKRGIFLIQMFYNIIVSKPFAEHYGIKTQDRHVKITPLLEDYTRKSIAAFVKEYPNVGLLTTLGEAMGTIDDDVDWFTKVIIPGVQDGLKAQGRTDEPPILLRAHDTDCKRVMEAALPLYKNLYTMHKYTGESLTTYYPQGPWAEIHRSLAALGSTHISNVHILANLEPWRWSSPEFIQRTVQAMHVVHDANALHLYPQSSYWDWPYTADKLPNGERERQIDRDWMWYSAWGRYAWNCYRQRDDEKTYWDDTLAHVYGTEARQAAKIREALEWSGEIAPDLLHAFGITEGNRQTLLLGMFCSQIVNPYKYTVYPGFYESTGPTNEKLIEYVEKNFKGQSHTGLLPLDVIEKAMKRGDKAVAAIEKAAPNVTKDKDEFERLRNDIHCYREFAYAFANKVKACECVLNYKYNNNLDELDKAVPLLEKSLGYYRKLVTLTNGSYLYANSMQTTMRRIPIAGDDGRMKHWNELLPEYEKELANFKKNIALLRAKADGTYKASDNVIKPYKKAIATFDSQLTTTVLKKGAKLFSDLDSLVTDLAPELNGLTAYVMTSAQQRNEGTSISFTTDKPVTFLVGYFRDDQKKYAKAPKLEVDATANDYGQADAAITSAIRIKGMPQVNIHTYTFPAGKNTLNLPKGFALVLGATNDKVVCRDAALAGADSSIDWLFY